MSDQVAQRVISIVASVKRIPVDAVSIESAFEQFEQLGIDSLDIMFERKMPFVPSKDEAKQNQTGNPASHKAEP